MHGSVRDGLEDLLAAKSSAGANDVFCHLNGCRECAAELDEFQAHADMLRSLRTPEEVEPGPGFYARVLQRIEERAKKSMWWVFAYSPVGKRLAYISLATAVILGSYVVTQESREGNMHFGSRTGTLVADDVSVHYDVPVVGNAEQQREAVLANFASHPGTLQ